ncbi:MAG: hypothetical protein ACEQSD_06075, partial [Flavobacteriales bacterium]
MILVASKLALREMSMRHYRFTDRLIQGVDQALRSVVPNSTQAERPSPAQQQISSLSVEQARHVAGLMRVNHSG